MIVFAQNKATNYKKDNFIRHPIKKKYLSVF